MNNNYKISIIIPIYNSEKYIGKCIESLFSQDMDNLEFIFVDDGSTDKSISIIESLLQLKYFSLKNCVNIIRLRKNRGIANARNIGIANAHGDYIGFVDSDDWVETNMFSVLYSRAIEFDFDIVCCSFVKEYPHVSSPFLQPYTLSKDTNIRRLLIGSLFPSLWCEIVKTSLYARNNIHFIANINMGEDLLVNIQLQFCANSFSFVDETLYHYRLVDTSVCYVRSLCSINNDITVAKYIQNYFEQNGVFDNYNKEVLCRKFFAKLPLYTSSKNRNIKLWISIFPESNKHIFSYPRLNWKMKIEYWLASHHLIKLANIFIMLLRMKKCVVLMWIRKRACISYCLRFIRC